MTRLSNLCDRCGCDCVDALWPVSLDVTCLLAMFVAFFCGLALGML